MLKNDIYNIDREFDYDTVRSIVLESLEKLVKEEALKRKSNAPSLDVFDYGPVDNNLSNVSHPAPPTPLLKLKIRNTTEYLNWRLLILKRDNFACRMCHASVKENKSLRLDVHHPRRFEDLCKENNLCTVEQALGCEELWSMNNGICICHNCHKEVEKLRTKLRNMFYYFR